MVVENHTGLGLKKDSPIISTRFNAMKFVYAMVVANSCPIGQHFATRLATRSAQNI